MEKYNVISKLTIVKRKLFFSFIFISLFILLITISSPLVSSISSSNESIEAKKNIDLASNCIQKIIELKLPNHRINLSFQEAVQLYEAQSLLEMNKKNADYKRVNEDALDVCKIKENEINAKDALDVFVELYREAGKEINLSSMEEDYKNILRSFEEERFEDTFTLIDKGYLQLSEVQATQTALHIFYDSTTATLKNFIINNWVRILIILFVLSAIGFLFRYAIKRYYLTAKMNDLMAQKNGLNKLIKKLQGDYFEKRTISDGEFNVKLTRFKEMMRDIDRQIPLIKEEMVLISRVEKKQENIISAKIKETTKGLRSKSGLKSSNGEHKRESPKLRKKIKRGKK